MIESPFKVHEVSFRWYKPDEILLGKKMREHLKFALSYWHTLCAEGSDLFGASVLNKNFGGKDAMQIYKNKADAARELMNLLSAGRCLCFCRGYGGGGSSEISLRKGI